MLNLRKVIVENRTNSRPLNAKNLEITDKKRASFALQNSKVRGRDYCRGESF